MKDFITFGPSIKVRSFFGTLSLDPDIGHTAHITLENTSGGAYSFYVKLNISGVENNSSTVSIPAGGTQSYDVPFAANSLPEGTHTIYLSVRATDTDEWVISSQDIGTVTIEAPTPTVSFVSISWD